MDEVKTLDRRVFLGAAAFSAMSAFGNRDANAAATYDPGASDTEIKIGQFGPLSGPVSAWGGVASGMSACFRMVNDNGGINGRKIRFINYDDAYSPPKSVEAARKLVEGDEVLFVSGAMGTPGNIAVQKYMNSKKVPHVFLVAAAGKLADAIKYPWSMVGGSIYEHEGAVAAKFVARDMPDAKIAVLFQNDDAGKAVLAGFKSELGARSSRIVSEASYTVVDPTVDSQIVQLRSSDADVLYLLTAPKAAVQALTKIRSLNWSPKVLLGSGNSSVHSTLRPAGLENVQGVYATATRKDLGNPSWAERADVKEYGAFLKRYSPDTDGGDDIFAIGYSTGANTVHILKQCGDDLTRANVLRQVTSLNGYRSPLSIPGITMNTSRTDYVPVKQFQMLKFSGDRYEPIGDLLAAT